MFKVDKIVNEFALQVNNELLPTTFQGLISELDRIQEEFVEFIERGDGSLENIDKIKKLGFRGANIYIRIAITAEMMKDM